MPLEFQEPKYGLMAMFMEGFTETHKEFTNLLKTFSDFDTPPTDYLHCDFSQRTLKHHEDYFGEGVRFTLVIPGDPEEIEILDFETFLIEVKKFIDIYLRENSIAEKEAEEIKTLFDEIQENMLPYLRR